MVMVMDIVVVAVVVLCAVIGWRRGFVKSVSGLVSLLLAVVLVSALAAPVGEKIDREWVRPWATERIIAAAGDEVSAGTAIESLDIVSVNTKIADTFGVNIIGVDPQQTPTVGQYVESVLETNTITSGISTALAAVILFVASSVIIWLITLLLKPLLKIKALKKCNSLLGLGIGLVNAAVILCVLSAAVAVYGSTPAGANFGPQEVEQTLIFQYVHTINPLRGWLIH